MDEHKIRISAKCFCFDSQGKVLLVKSNQGDFWSTPGGGVEENESLTAAAKREVMEETGYTVKVDRFVFIQDYQTKTYKIRNIEVFFVGKIDESIPQATEYDHEFRFFTEEEFLKLVFRPEGVNPFKLREVEGVEYGTYLR